MEILESYHQLVNPQPVHIRREGELKVCYSRYKYMGEVRTYETSHFFVAKYTYYVCMYVLVLHDMDFFHVVCHGNLK